MHINSDNLFRLKKIVEKNKEKIKKNGFSSFFSLLFMAIVEGSNINPLLLQTYAFESDSISSFSEENIEINVDNSDFKVNDFISIEEKIIFILQHYQMSEVDFQTFVNAVILESSLCGSSFDQNQIVAILYDLAMIPNEIKINHILMTRGITMEQLSKTSQVVLAEAAHDGTNYVDAFGVTTILNNREVSPIWSECGLNVYEQAFAKGQFSVVSNGRMNQFINRSDLIGYQAFLDCLYLDGTLPMHGYTSFKAWSRSSTGKIAFVHGGNRYEFRGELTLEARAKRYVLTDPMQLQYFSDIQNPEVELVKMLGSQNN